nr:unnamed protein product [Callosobruchus chinensis]
MAAYSNCLRRSVKWYRKLAFEFITGTSVVNALYFYNKINDKKISVTTFKENLAMQIFRSINPPNASDTSIEHRLTEKTDQDNKPKRGRCKCCYEKYSQDHGRDYAVKHSKRVSYVCPGCDENCFVCFDCFFKKHAFKKIN